MPATFFIVGKALESDPRGYRELLDDPLFEIASHTYSHRMLRDHPVCGRSASSEQIREEVYRSKEVIEQTFGHACRGMRTGCGFKEGLRGSPNWSSWSRTRATSTSAASCGGRITPCPARCIRRSVTRRRGAPTCGSCRVTAGTKTCSRVTTASSGWARCRVLLFPPLYPEAIPDGFISTPDEEFRWNNRVFIDRAARDHALFVSLVWHPWSLAMFDPEMRMLEMTFEYVREQGLEPITYAGLRDLLSQADDSHTGL